MPYFLYQWSQSWEKLCLPHEFPFLPGWPGCSGVNIAWPTPCLSLSEPGPVGKNICPLVPWSSNVPSWWLLSAAAQCLKTCEWQLWLWEELWLWKCPVSRSLRLGHWDAGILEHPVISVRPWSQTKLIGDPLTFDLWRLRIRLSWASSGALDALRWWPGAESLEVLDDSNILEQMSAHYGLGFRSSSSWPRSSSGPVFIDEVFGTQWPRYLPTYCFWLPSGSHSEHEHWHR